MAVSTHPVTRLTIPQTTDAELFKDAFIKAQQENEALFEAQQPASESQLGPEGDKKETTAP